MLSLLTLCALSGPVALAQEPIAEKTTAEDERARELWENGAILYSEGRYEDAIAAWQEAYRLSQRQLILTNIANAQERLGQWDKALATLNRYRAFAPAEERGALDRRIANLERRLSEQATPEPVTVPYSALVEPPAPVPVAVPPPSGPSLGLPVALLVGGVVGTGVGVGFGVMALNAREEARGICAAYGEEDELLCPNEAAGALLQDHRFSLAADLSYATGGVLLATGVAVLLRTRKVENRGFQAGLAPAPGGGVLVLMGGF